MATRPTPDEALLLERIVENLPDMIFVKDAAELRFVRFNRAGERLLGHSREALIGKNDYDFFPTEEADFFTAKDRTVLAGDDVVDIPEEPIHTAAHGLRWLHTKKIPIRGADGGQLYLLGISQDITELRDARIALQEREARLRVLLESFPGIVWTADAEGHVTWIGGARAALLDSGSNRGVGRRVSDLIAGADSDIAALHAAALAGTAGSFAFSAGDRDFEARVDRGDEAGGAVFGVALDVTERRRLEAERVEVRLQRAQRMEALGVLAGGIAHDFNNLLVGMLGNASLARLKLPPDSPARAEIERLIAAADRAADLTRQMLAYSGKGKFLVEAVDLRELVRETTDLVRTSFSRRARLECRLGSHLAPVEADATQIRQVVMNLLTNAAEALPEAGGVVTVELSMVELGDPNLITNSGDVDLPEGSFVVLEVSDTGCGMDDATRRRMFDPFFTTKPTGHGLGLAAALGIVRGHRGAIRVYSEPGRGTTVRVLLPSATSELRSGALPVPRPPAAPTTAVLVVDDESAVRDFVRAVLEHHGFEVVDAADGTEALTAYARHRARIGLVLLDLTMPGLDGEETFHALRELNPQIQVLLSSGYNEQQATSRFTGLGLAGFLRKPYRAEQLIDLVRAQLAGRGD